MNLDHFTYQDLSIFSSQEELSVFHKLNFTKTQGGRDCLYNIFKNPLQSISEIKDTQDAIRIFNLTNSNAEQKITNGTIVVMEKFLDYQLDPMPVSRDRINPYLYRIFHSPDYSMARFSLIHFHEFMIGISEIYESFKTEKLPKKIGSYIERIKTLLHKNEIQKFVNKKKGISFSIQDTIHYARFFYLDYRKQIEELIEIYFQFDAWQSMAKAITTYNLQFPEFIETESPIFQGEGLYHLLLPDAVAYDIRMDPQSNFIFLTGANMAGKSTFIKAIGLTCFLAHLGLGVPARNLKLSLFEGILTNINIADNIIKGESYFFNEVKRIKDTINRINDGRKWMVLIDELFKGTNIQDAMKCSLTVIQGLIKIRQCLFVLSTHLYEIAEELEQYKNISFKYFETNIDKDQLQFKFLLKNGISNDRIGYLILKKEGVVELLESLK